MNNVSYSPGMLYIEHPDGELQLLGGIVDSKMFRPELDRYREEMTEIILTNDQKATFAFHMSKKQIENFYDIVFGITKTLLPIIRGEGNKRVAHLAKYGRKSRTRKKNVRRAFRIAERMANDENG